jgi:monoamine oxidase
MPTAAQPRIAIIGAGFSGLAAAVDLSRAGAQVKLFEARHRVGGRVWSQIITDGQRPVVIERGAEFVLHGYDVLREYCAEYHLDLIDSGMSYYVRDTPELPGVTPSTMAALGARAVEACAALTQPASVAALLDTLDAHPDDRAALRARIEISAAVDANRINAAGVFDTVASAEPAPSWRIGGGNQRLAHAMADEIGDRLTLSEPVSAVTVNDEGLNVVTSQRNETFDFVIVAIPFGLLPRGLDIQLPEWKRIALGHLSQGNAAKLHLPLAATPTTSAVMSVTDRFWTWTAIDDHVTASPVLNCFAGNLNHLTGLQVEHGPQAWAQRARTLRPDLNFADAPPTLTAWHLDEWARGAYANHAPEFTAEDAAALREPVGNIFFAGEYTDAEQTGLMEGALRSGRRAAAQIQAIMHSAAG